MTKKRRVPKFLRAMSGERWKWRGQWKGQS